MYGQAIPDYLREHPTESLVQSGSWANGIETFPEYFLTEPERQRLQTLYFDIFCPPPEIEKVPAGLTIILSESDRIQVERSGLFKPIVPTLEIPFPDGRVGFTFAKLEYVDNVAELLMPERQRRVALVDAKVSVLGVPATTSRLDIGQASDIFDGTLNTLARGMAANPFILKVKFSTPVKIRDVSAMFGTTAMDWKASANLAGKQVATASGASPEPLVTDPWLTLSLGVAPVELDELHFELHQRDALPDRAHIHVFEVELK